MIAIWYYISKFVNHILNYKNIMITFFQFSLTPRNKKPSQVRPVHFVWSHLFHLSPCPSSQPQSPVHCDHSGRPESSSLSFSILFHYPCNFWFIFPHRVVYPFPLWFYISKELRLMFSDSCWFGTTSGLSPSIDFRHSITIAWVALQRLLSTFEVRPYVRIELMSGAV